MTIPYLTPSEIRGQQAGLAHHYERKKSWIAGREFADAHIRTEIIKRFGTSARVLEIGSSDGKMIRHLLAGGLQNIIGVDVDVYVPEDLRTHLKIADLNKDPIPAEDQSQDVVLAFEIFEHLENPWHVVRELARVLKPGGRLYLSMPWGHSVWDKWRFVMHGNLVGYHLRNNHITFLTRDVFAKAFAGRFTKEYRFFDRGYLPVPRAYIVKRFLPPHPWWSLKVCYVMERK